MKKSSEENQTEPDSEFTETEIKQKLDAYYKVCISCNFIILNSKL